jgi:nitrite reductase (NO-forming)
VWLVAAAGLCVTAALVVLGYLLVVEVRGASVRRFLPARRYYLAAVGAGTAGTVFGAAMVAGSPGWRDAHVALMLLGFVGLVVAGTLPSFAATQLRMKMAARATPRRLAANLAWLVACVAVTVVGALSGRGTLEGVAAAAYALGVAHVVTMLPHPGRKQLSWAGPRVVQLAAGVAWWVAVVAGAGVAVVRGGALFPERLVVALVLGGYAQILVASFAYLGPVLRAGGHERLTAGFAVTRSYVAVVAANLAAVAWLADWPTVTAAGAVVLAGDVAVRAVRLARRAPGTAVPVDADAAVAGV